MKKIVLAYSDGLDTSAILKWLINNGYEVVWFMGDSAQEIEPSVPTILALTIGATDGLALSCHAFDLKENHIIFPWTD